MATFTSPDAAATETPFNFSLLSHRKIENAVREIRLMGPFALFYDLFPQILLRPEKFARRYGVCPTQRSVRVNRGSKQKGKPLHEDDV
jgi:hypothetical protein